MLKLYFAAKTCAVASHIALEDAGANYEAIRLDFSKGEQRDPAFVAINPKARVPALVTSRGVLTETPALLLYIAQTHPEASLAPLADPYALAELQAFNSYLCSTVHVAHAHKHRGARWSDDEAARATMTKKVAQNMKQCFALIETTYFKGPWVLGANYSVADAYLFTIASWLEGDGVDPHQFPNVLDHRNRMGGRPAVKRVMALHG
jgi:glutathione S-transferase